MTDTRAMTVYLSVEGVGFKSYANKDQEKLQILENYLTPTQIEVEFLADSYISVTAYG